MGIHIRAVAGATIRAGIWGNGPVVPTQRRFNLPKKNQAISKI